MSKRLEQAQLQTMSAAAAAAAAADGGEVVPDMELAQEFWLQTLVLAALVGARTAARAEEAEAPCCALLHMLRAQLQAASGSGRASDDEAALAIVSARLALISADSVCSPPAGSPPAPVAAALA